MVASFVFPKGGQIPTQFRFIRCFSVPKDRLFQPSLLLDGPPGARGGREGGGRRGYTW